MFLILCLLSVLDYRVHESLHEPVLPTAIVGEFGIDNYDDLIKTCVWEPWGDSVVEEQDASSDL